MSDRATFSPFWHRVRVMRPRLRPHVQITRQHYRGQRWHVIHDPTSNAFFRLNPVAHEFVGLLDGRRGVEEVWHHGLTRHGDMALTQNEVIQLLSQLFNANLRFAWLNTAGTGLFIVFNDGEDAESFTRWTLPISRTLTVKYTRQFDLAR